MIQLVLIDGTNKTNAVEFLTNSKQNDRLSCHANTIHQLEIEWSEKYSSKREKVDWNGESKTFVRQLPVKVSKIATYKFATNAWMLHGDGTKCTLQNYNLSSLFGVFTAYTFPGNFTRETYIAAE